MIFVILLSRIYHRLCLKIELRRRKERDGFMTVKLVESSITRDGVRKARLVKMGAAITKQEWSGFVPGEVALGNVALHEVRDPELDVYHLEISWMARELVKKEDDVMVWWWLGGMSIGFGLECAASLFCEELGKMPKNGLTLKLPKIYDPVVEVEYEGQVGRVKVGTAVWVPWGFVVAHS
jgi:hypothetical protein